MEREEAERLVARYGPSVYRLAYARTGSKEDAEDVMQETFLRLVRAAPEFRDEEHGKAWLLRVATHCAADVFRMPWRKRDLPLEAARGVSSAPPKEPDSNVLAAVLSLAAGIGCAAALDHLVPHDAFDADTGEAPHKNLFRVGFVSALAMALHNFPEGVATFLAGYEDLTLGVSITLAIALHNIPEGISVAMPVWYATGSRRRAFRCTLLSGLTEPVGAVLAFALLRPFLNGLLLGVLFGAVAGIMVYIAVEELIPSSRQYGHDRPALWATLCGICVMPLTHLFQT